MLKTVPFDNVDGRYGYAAPTQAGIYDVQRYAWKAPVQCYVNVSIAQTVRFDIDYGKTSARLELWKNGAKIQDGAKALTTKDDTNFVSAQLTKEKLLLQAGDELTVKLQLKGEGGLIGDRWGYRMFEYAIFSVDGTYLKADQFRVEIQEDFPPSGVVQLQNWLPDMEQKEFVKAIIGLYGLTQQSDPYSGVIKYTPTSTVLQNLASAPSWDARQDRSQPTTRSWHLNGIAQQNWFRWKEDSANPESAKELGDGFLACADTTLEKKEDLLTMPFAASPVGTNGLLLLPFFTKQQDGPTDDGEPVYQTQNLQPRLVVQGDDTRAVVLSDGTATRSVITRIAVFAVAGDLDFGRVLLPTYYAHLASVLKRPLMLQLSVALSAVEVQAFDQLQPIYLEAEGHYFWINKLDQFQRDEASTAVDLLRLSGLNLY